MDYLAGIRDGNTKILRRFYADVFPMVRDLIQKNGGVEADAKDIFQDAVLVLYQKAKLPDFQLTSKLTTYFYRVCQNLWLNHTQKKSYSKVTILEDAKYMASESADFDFKDLEQRKLFNKAFSLLGKDCQKVLLLFFQKISMKDMAKKMGFGSEGYARGRKLQCKDKLVKLVKKQPEFKELLNEPV